MLVMLTLSQPTRWAESVRSSLNAVGDGFHITEAEGR